MAWRTLLDVFKETGKLPAGVERLEAQQGSRMPYVKCTSRPNCGRRVSADMMIELDGGFMCDGCLEVLRVKEGISRRGMTARVGGYRKEMP